MGDFSFDEPIPTSETVHWLEYRLPATGYSSSVTP
jgi:hypothetical protein